jgi:protein TonB
LSAGSYTYQPASPLAPVEDPNVIIDGAKADVAADFKGGINAFVRKLHRVLILHLVDQSGVVSATITFVVEKDGTFLILKSPVQMQILIKKPKEQ